VRRGDVVLSAASGDFGKPRPCVVIQDTDLNAMLDTLILCPMTSDVRGRADFRPKIAPDGSNGLKVVSEAMVDKSYAQLTRRVKGSIGALSPEDLKSVDRALRIVLNLR
jgi:mRNA interferase MazF